MPVFTFETIGAAEALGFDPGRSQLIFSTPGASTSNIRLGFDDATGRTSITSELTGRTVVFGTGLFDNPGTITFEDGSRLMFGGNYHTGSYSNPVPGGAGRDLMLGTPRTDKLIGGAGNDTLVGGSDRDLLTGGEGRDLFIIRPPESYHTSVDFSVDSVTDWSADDSISFGPIVGNAGNFAVLASTISIQQAKVAADALIAAGVVDFVAAPVSWGGSSSLYLFADSKQDNGGADTWVSLGYSAGAVPSLPTITANQIVATRAMTFTSSGQLVAPTRPAEPGGLQYGYIGGNMDLVQLRLLQGATISRNEPTVLSLDGLAAIADLIGTGFTYDNNALLTGGTLTRLFYEQAGTDFGPIEAEVAVTGLSVASFGAWVATNANDTALRTLFAGNQSIYGSAGTDLIRGYGGNDVIRGYSGGSPSIPTFDSLFGGDGDDQIFAGTTMMGSQTFMRGETGNDYMFGSAGFDDMHGNQGQDTIIGGFGDDWVVGGQGNDMLYGEVGDDIVYGNMGDDTCVGGDGADTVRGGQNDDVVYGDAGNDWLSGDRGADTLTGGAGADIFYAMRETGVDRVLDFRVTEGDRVMLDVGTAYTVRQAGADTVIDMNSGNQMVLVGVNMADLSAGWIFYG